MVTYNVKGLMTAVFTPLNKDYTINYRVIPQYVKYVVDSGIKSVLVGGTTGENVCLTLSDRKRLVDAWMKESKNTDLHIQVHVGGGPLPNVVELASYCQSVGVHSLLTLPELYFKPTNVDDLVFNIGEVAKAAPQLPIIYYHNPKRSNVDVNMVDFVKAATDKIPNFKGLKYAPSDLSEAMRILRALKPDQELLFANESLLAAATLLGIKSTVCTIYSLFPKLSLQIVEAVENNDVNRARSLQETLSLAIEAHLEAGPSVQSMKAGMEIVSGINMGPPCLPNRPISSEAKQILQKKLRSLGLCN